MSVKNIPDDDNDKGEVIIYKTEDGLTHIDVKMENDTVWLTQAQMSELFQRERSVISKHIRNIFAEGELDEKSNVQNLHIANSDKPVAFYNLDVIISVGYRVKSIRGTQFRIWANSILKEYLIKGFSMNDERLKQLGGGNYWRELLDRIRKRFCIVRSWICMRPALTTIPRARNLCAFSRLFKTSFILLLTDTGF